MELDPVAVQDSLVVLVLGAGEISNLSLLKGGKKLILHIITLSYDGYLGDGLIASPARVVTGLEFVAELAEDIRKVNYNYIL